MSENIKKINFTANGSIDVPVYDDTEVRELIDKLEARVAALEEEPDNPDPPKPPSGELNLEYLGATKLPLDAGVCRIGGFSGTRVAYDSIPTLSALPSGSGNEQAEGLAFDGSHLWFFLETYYNPPAVLWHYKIKETT